MKIKLFIIFILIFIITFFLVYISYKKGGKTHKHKHNNKHHIKPTNYPTYGPGTPCPTSVSINYKPNKIIDREADKAKIKPKNPNLSGGFINVLNDIGVTIRVSFDNLYPPCLNSRNDPNSKDSTCTWSDNDGEMYINETNISTRQQIILNPGDVLRVKIPKNKDTNLTEWCAYNASNEWGCPGVGIWITLPCIGDGIAPGNVMRAEFNVNVDKTEPKFWYNLSGVEGINSGMTMEYTNESENDRFTMCWIPMVSEQNGCPWKIKDNSCPSTKHETTNFNAGCGTSDPRLMLECRKWWATNSLAQDWIDYLQHNKYPHDNNKAEYGVCNMYAWAYDELLWDPKTQKVIPNPIDPLRKVSYDANADLNIVIKDLVTI